MRTRGRLTRSTCSGCRPEWTTRDRCRSTRSGVGAITNAGHTGRECDGAGVELEPDMTTIGLIGGGKIGSTVARLATAAGYDIVLSNSRGPETLADLVSELGPRARAATPAEAGDLGYDTVDAGPLAEGWRYQPDTPAYCAVYQQPGDWQTGVPADAATVLAAAQRRWPGRRR